MDSREKKLNEAKSLLEALGLPPAQCNDRSGWVLLALANVRPEDSWATASDPMLPTVEIMEFIRQQYGQDYKPNSRETIRRQTLHQFEQARLVDRNRDDPSRPTNSALNNYALTPAMLDIARAYPDGNWREKMEQYAGSLVRLKEEYSRRLDLAKVPVTLPNGQTITLSPGKHNQLHADIIHEFCPRFIGGSGVVLYIGDTASSRQEGGKLMLLENEQLAALGVPPMAHDKLPDIVVHDAGHNWLFLIEAVTSHGPVSPKRWQELEAALKDCNIGRVYVTAFPDNATFRRHAADIAWETEVWIADAPDHMIHFNGDRFLGPHQ